MVVAVSAYAADWNETLIYNPKWPPHAKGYTGTVDRLRRHRGIHSAKSGTRRGRRIGLAQSVASLLGAQPRGNARHGCPYGSDSLGRI
jgi:hypothetical protein